jgi:hypothetical protein
MGEDVQVSGIQCGDDPRAGPVVGIVTVAGRGSRPGFDQDLKPQADQLLHGIRRRSNPPLALAAFPQNA